MGTSFDLNDRGPKKAVVFLLYSSLSVILMLIVGTRDVSVGTDTQNYYEIYEIINDDSWPDYAKRWEPLYQYINYFAAWFNGGAKLALFFSSFLTLASYFIFIYRFSPRAFLSVILFVSVFGYLLVFNVVRHSLAAAFLVWAIYYLSRAERLKFLAFFLVAFFFHYTALVSLLSFLFFRLFCGHVRLLFLWLLSFCFLVFKPLTLFFSDFFSDFGRSLLPGYSYYFNDIVYSPSLSFKSIFLQVLFFLLYLYYRRLPVSYKDFSLAAMLSVVLYNFFFYLEYFNRIPVYFFLFFPVVIPMVLDKALSGYGRLTVKFLVIILCMVFLARSILSGSNGIFPYSSWLFVS